MIAKRKQLSPLNSIDLLCRWWRVSSAAVSHSFALSSRIANPPWLSHPSVLMSFDHAWSSLASLLRGVSRFNNISIDAMPFYFCINYSSPKCPLSSCNVLILYRSRPIPVRLGRLVSESDSLLKHEHEYNKKLVLMVLIVCVKSLNKIAPLYL